MERIARDESLGKKEGERLHTRCSIRVHSLRKKLCDPDGQSAKALLDGLAKAGVFEDDSARFIKEISYSQEVAKGRDEETIIDIIFDDD